MRIAISLWACLGIFCGQTFATTADNNNPITKEKVEITTSKTTVKKEIKTIPNRTLKVEVLEEKELLHISLSGQNEKLDWIIFQPKGKVLSRITTSTKIDEIKIDNLDSGLYVLMIKDPQGRMLYKSFNKA